MSERSGPWRCGYSYRINRHDAGAYMERQRVRPAATQLTDPDTSSGRKTTDSLR